MMRVRTSIGPSTIPGAGLGVFVAEPVQAGQVIWEFDTGLDILLDGMPQEPVLRAYVEKYGYEPLGEPGQWLLCVDDGRFINHSDQPNTSDTRNQTIATVAMAPGTEITSDYRAFARQPFLGWPDVSAEIEGVL